MLLKKNIIILTLFLHAGEDFSHQRAIVIGWGEKGRGRTVNFLKEGIVRVLSHQECVASGSGLTYQKLSSQALCAAEVGVDSCKVQYNR